MSGKHVFFSLPTARHRKNTDYNTECYMP